MADMKQIFTYPNNGTSDFIDPNYVGNASSGLTRRVDDLLDGTYRDWSNLDPISDLGTTTSEAMQNLSTFINYYGSKQSIQNLTFYDFWYNPMIVGTKTLINGISVSTVVYNPGTPPAPDTTIFTTTSSHSFADGDLLILSGFNGAMTQFNGDTFYAKVLSPTTLQLAYDSALTNLFVHGSNSTGTFDTFDWEVQGAIPPNTGYQIDRTFKIDLTNFVPDPGQDIVQSVLDGTRMDVNTIEKNGQGLVNNSYWLKGTGSPFQYEVYEDSGLTNPLLGSEITGLTTYQKQARITPSDLDATGTPLFMTLETEIPLTAAESWVNLPVSQQLFQWTGFPNQLVNFYSIPLGQMEYFKNAPISGYQAITVDGIGHTGVTDYYYFNDYYNIDLTGTYPKMHFASLNYNKDPINSPNVDYQYEVLAYPGSRWKVAPGPSAYSGKWHCLPIFDGFKFDNITRGGIHNLPVYGDMVYTQGGLPVLDPGTVTLRFDSVTPNVFVSPIASIDGLNISLCNVVLWKPGTNVDDYRMEWDDYGLLNIMEKDGSNQWTVPIWTEATVGANDTIWTFNGAGVGAPALVVQSQETGTPGVPSSYTHRLYQDSQRPQDNSTSINTHTFNTVWGTNYDSTTNIDIQVSPMPHDLGTGKTGKTWNANSSPNSYPYYYDPTGGPSGLYGDQRPVGYRESGPGIQTHTNYYPQVGTRPNLFQLINEVTINPLVTGDINAEFIEPSNTIADAGDLAIDSGFPYQYELSSLDIVLPGNESYSYQDTNNVTQYAAEIDSTRYWDAGDSSPTLYPTTGETSPTVNVTVNGSGKLQSLTMTTEGRYLDADPVLIQLQSPASTYVPPTPTQAELEDVWNTQDQWATDGEAQKEWPWHVTPMSAEINYNAPTITNNSQSGIKYTRSAGHTKWTLDVVYPPMSASDFKIFHAIAQAAHGQSTPFYFVLRTPDNTPLLWRDFRSIVSTSTPLFKDAVEPGDTLALFEGFASNEPNA